jgi:hypothetical protein
MLHAKNLTTGFICLPIQAAVAILVTLTILAMFGRPRLWEMVGIGIVVMSFATTLAAAALAARAAGFRLDIGNRLGPKFASLPGESELRPSGKVSIT